MRVLCSLYLLAHFALCCADLRNNVCKTFVDYQTIRTNKDCWYNPDVNAKPIFIAKRYGFNLQRHKVITEDGYILTLHRVVPKKSLPKGPPVLLHHGFSLSSVFWMIMGKRSTAFKLVEGGFDVWLANARGNTYSMNHVNLSTADPKFWDFSFDEIGLYDLPAVLEYIKNQTKDNGKIIFVGHSMGSTVSYVYASMLPTHAQQHLKMLISIAPIAFLGNTKNWFDSITFLFDVFKKELPEIGLYGTGQYPFINNVVRNVCSNYPAILFCQYFTSSIIGATPEQLQPETVPLFLLRYPSSFSMKTALHYLQEIKNDGNFERFDNGEEENLKLYNTTKPPSYDLSKIRLPVYLIYGNNDLIATEKDVLRLYESLQGKKCMKLLNVNGTIPFNHNDFLYSKYIDVFNEYLLSIMLENVGNNKCP